MRVSKAEHLQISELVIVEFLTPSLQICFKVTGTTMSCPLLL